MSWKPPAIEFYNQSASCTSWEASYAVCFSREMFNAFFFLKKVELLLQFLGSFQVLISSPVIFIIILLLMKNILLLIGKIETTDCLQFPNSS